MKGGMMSEIISFTLLNMAYCLGMMMVAMICYAYDKSCENLLVIKNDDGDGDD